MTKDVTSFGVSTRLLVKAGLVAAAVMGIPALSVAATFAYVNNLGEVSTVVADTAATALMIAPNKDERSGVLLLDSAQDNEVVGDHVGGV